MEQECNKYSEESLSKLSMKNAIAWKPIPKQKILILFYAVQYIRSSIYTQYNIYALQYVRSTIYTQYNIYAVQYIGSTIYTQYNIYAVQYIRSTIYTLTKLE